GKSAGAPWQIAVLEGVGQGLNNTGRSLAKLWDDPPAKLKAPLEDVRSFFTKAGEAAQNEKLPLAERLSAVRLLGYGPYAVAKKQLPELLAPQQPQELQLAAVRALGLHQQASVAPTLLGQWKGFGPTVRREVLEAIFSRPERVKSLLTAIAEKKVIAGQIEPARLEQLRKHPVSSIRAQANKLLAGQA